MSWTYSGNPASSDTDRLRFELGDVNSADPLLSDEEIAYCLAQESTFMGALARAAEAVAQRFAREATTQVGSLGLQLSERAKVWGERAKEYRRRVTSAAVPSLAAVPSDAIFSVGMHDAG